RPQRARGDEHRRTVDRDDRLLGRHAHGDGDRRGHRRRDERGDAVADVRPLLHDQAAGHRSRDGAGPVGRRPARRRAGDQQRPGKGNAGERGAASRAGVVVLRGSARMRHTVLVVDDEASIADGLRLTLEAEGYSVRIAGSVRTALAAVTHAEAHVAIVDLMLPDGDGLALARELKPRDPALAVIVIPAYGSVRKAMEATKGAGAFHVVEKPFEPDEVLGLVKTALEHRKLVVENTELRRRLVDQTADSEILGSAPGIQRVMETIASVADTDANVLIIGESGTGKELIANALHEKSSRREGPFVKINCAALPKDLIES